MNSCSGIAGSQPEPVQEHVRAWSWGSLDPPFLSLPISVVLPGACMQSESTWVSPLPAPEFKLEKAAFLSSPFISKLLLGGVS